MRRRSFFPLYTNLKHFSKSVFVAILKKILDSDSKIELVWLKTILQRCLICEVFYCLTTDDLVVHIS